jgi:hypothetical protein
VKSIKHIMIIEEKVSQHLEKLKSKWTNRIINWFFQKQENVNQE